MSGSDVTEANLRHQVIPTGGCHDCGGRCPYKLHVEAGRVVRMEPDELIRACVRGYAYRQRVYAGDRLRQPLKRVGARGEGDFAEISWDEALDAVASELRRVRDTYGSRSILLTNLSGSPGGIHGDLAVLRLLNMSGGCVTCWGGPSAEGFVFASRATYGTLETGNSRDDLVNSHLIIMWGWNPVETIFSTNTSFQLIRAKEAGARIIGVDPRHNRSIALLADKWIPIKPGTDTAMLVSMAYVIIEESLQDVDFIGRYAVGFQEFKSYVMGEEDSVPKTPEWAEGVTGVPAETIRDLAREYAKTKPAALITGYGPGRTSFGEQFHRAAATLATLTANVGISGGSAAGFDRVLGIATHAGPFIPPGRNPTEAGSPRLKGSLDVNPRNRTRVHWSKVWDAILEGTAGGYPGDIKLLYVAAMNPLNQCLNTNKGLEALRRLESIIVHEQFMTPTAKYADIVLPVNTHWARDDLMRPWYGGAYYICVNKAIDDLPQTKSDLEICAELAPRLGVTGYSDKSPEQWQNYLVETEADMRRDIKDLDKFRKEGVWRIPLDKPVISLRKQIETPDANPFPTPSGKIEIRSSRIAELNSPDLPAIPKYMEDKPKEPNKYPLQLISFHSRVRAHSCFDNVTWLRRLEPQTLWISREDATNRGIEDGSMVRVFNHFGEVRIPATVTERMMPGVVGIGEGAWYKPDEEGVDKGGNPNVLMEDRHSPGGAFVSNSSFVEVKSSLNG